MRVVIPAHNEERVVGNLVADLQRQVPRSRSCQVWVLADRCGDDTAAVAARAGSRVAERRSGPDGKGELLKWHLREHPLAGDEALVVLDADNRVESDFLALVSEALGAGETVVQASVLPSNLQASAIAAAAGLGDWMAREVINKRAAARGWPVQLGGTGFCVTAPALSAAGGWSGSLAEDLDLTVRLLLAGHVVRYLPGVRVRDEKPTRLGAAVGQRRRWAQGRTGVRKERGGRLWKAAWTRRSLPMLSMAVRLAAPGRSLRFLSTAAVAAMSAAWGWGLPFSWPVWAAIALWIGGRPLWVLWKVKEVRPHLKWYPVTLVWGLVWLWVRLGPRSQGWYHTPHHGNVTER